MEDPQIPVHRWTVHGSDGSSVEVGCRHRRWDIPSGDVKIAIENCDFPIKKNDFPIKNCDFPWKMAIHSEFSLKHGGFP